MIIPVIIPSDGCLSDAGAKILTPCIVMMGIGVLVLFAEGVRIAVMDRDWLMAFLFALSFVGLLTIPLMIFLNK